MKFTTVLGSLTDSQMAKVRKAEEELSTVFTELSLGYDNKNLGSKIGGDPLVFNLVYSSKHVCDAGELIIDDLEDEKLAEAMKEGGTLTPEELAALPEDIKRFKAQLKGRVLRTAATDGRTFYWNPKFVLSKSRLGLRIITSHEAFHGIFGHSARRGNRIHGLFNIAIDYKVNHIIMEDLKARGFKDAESVDLFVKNLGDFIYLEEYAAVLKDPFNPPARLAHFDPMHDLKKMANPGYSHPGDKKPPMYYAEPALSGDFKRPEHIYDYLLKQIPKCPECGKLGMYKKPDEYKKLEKQLQEQQKKNKQNQQSAQGQKTKKDKNKKDQQQTSPGNQQPGGNQEEHQCEDHDHSEEGHQCDHQHDHGQPGQNPGQQPGGNQPGNQPGQTQGQGEAGEGEECDHGGCSTCGQPGSDYMHVPFGGDTLDDHIETDIPEEEMAKKMHEAMVAASKMAGKIPASLEDEIGQLSAPKLSWMDFIRIKVQKKCQGNGRSDWSKPRNRPLFAGLYVPRKYDYHVNILFAYDCSGSMSHDDIAYGVSQLQCLGNKATCYALPWDSVAYWDKMVKLDKINLDELKKIKAHGRGGTMVSDVFNQYEEKMPEETKIIIIATDGYLYDGELAGIKPLPKDLDILWLITSDNSSFNPKIGRVFHLNNM